MEREVGRELDLGGVKKEREREKAMAGVQARHT